MGPPCPVEHAAAQGVPAMTKRVYENGRSYKDGYAPSQIAAAFPISAYCAACGQQTLLIYPSGACSCSFCTPRWVQVLLANNPLAYPEVRS